MQGITIGLIQGDTRSLDYSSHGFSISHCLASEIHRTVEWHNGMGTYVTVPVHLTLLASTVVTGILELPVD